MRAIWTYDMEAAVVHDLRRKIAAISFDLEKLQAAESVWITARYLDCSVDWGLDCRCIFFCVACAMGMCLPAVGKSVRSLLAAHKRFLMIKTNWQWISKSFKQLNDYSSHQSINGSDNRAINQSL